MYPYTHPYTHIHTHIPIYTHIQNCMWTQPTLRHCTTQQHGRLPYIKTWPLALHQDMAPCPTSRHGHLPYIKTWPLALHQGMAACPTSRHGRLPYIKTWPLALHQGTEHMTLAWSHTTDKDIYVCQAKGEGHMETPRSKGKTSIRGLLLDPTPFLSSGHTPTGTH